MPSDPPEQPCRLCERPFRRAHLTQHHCRPKSKGGTMADVELLCGQCHGMVHATFTNATLAALYPTVAQLRGAPELAGFLKWVRKLPPGRRKANRSRKHKV